MKNTLRAAALLLLTLCLVPMAEAKRTPNLEFKDLTGQTQKLSGLRGSIAVVNFWATWCGPCREEMPLLSKLTQEYAGKKVRFIAVSADADPENRKNRAKIDLYLNTVKPTMDIWLGGDLDMLDKLSLGNVLPATVILDDQGEVVARIMGEAHEEDLRTAIDWLLNGKTGTAPQPVVKRY